MAEGSIGQGLNIGLGARGTDQLTLSSRPTDKGQVDSDYLHRLPHKAGAKPPIGIDIEKLSNDIERARVNSQYLRHNFERDWYRNVLFYVGQQWITYSRARRRWEKAKLEAWFPTPVTNRFASTVDTMASVLAQKKPNVTVYPATNNGDDIATSEVANRVLEVIDEEIDEQQVRKEVAKWTILCGHAFFYTYYDISPENGTIFLPNKACQTCNVSFSASQLEQGICPLCGSPELEVDETQGENLPKGRMISESCSPFEIYTDLQVGNLKDAKELLRIRTRSLEWAKHRYPEQADKIKGEGAYAETTGQYYLSALAYATNNSLGQYDSFFGGTIRGADNIERVQVYEYFRLPDNEGYPNGVYATKIGKNIVELTEYPFLNAKDEPVLPFQESKFFDVPGRFWGKTNADDLIFKQIQRNKIEGIIQLGLTRTANPIWLLPENVGVSKLTGEPGQIIRYNALNPSGAKPERVPGQEMPASLFRWLEKIDSDFEELSGAYQAFKGGDVRGVPTFSGLNLLAERAVSRFSELLSNWEKAYKQWCQHKLNLFKQNANEPRINTIQGENGEWETQEFTKASLAGDVNISIEAGSSVPKSKEAERQLALDLIKTGVIDLSDQKTRYQILEKFGMENLKEQYDIDVKDAIKELADFKKTGQTRFRPMIDDHMVHIQEHSKFAKEDEFFNLPPELQALWTHHIVNEHQAFVMGNVNQGGLGGLSSPRNSIGDVPPSPSLPTINTPSLASPPPIPNRSILGGRGGRGLRPNFSGGRVSGGSRVGAGSTPSAVRQPAIQPVIGGKGKNK